MTYYVNAPDVFGKRHWKAVGKHSEGMRPQTASRIREEIIAAGGITVGTGRAHERHTGATEDDVVATIDGRRGGSAEYSGTGNIRAWTFADAVGAYCEWAVGNGKYIKNPLGLYRLHCSRILDGMVVAKFTAEHAEALKRTLLGKGLSNQNVFHGLSFLRRVVNHAIATKRAASNPFACIRGGVFRMPRVEDRRLRFFTPEEARLLLGALRDRSPQVWSMAVLSIRTGMRATEIFGLAFDDIDAAAGCLHIRAKGGERQIVPVESDVLDMLAGIPRTPGTRLVFPDKFGRRHVHVPTTFQKVVKAVGLQVDAHSPYRVTFHTFRHTFASWLAQSGKVTLLELQILMRHRSICMTQRYAHLIPEDTQRKLAIVGELLG